MQSSSQVKETKSRLRQNVESLGMAILVALVVRSSVVEAFWVPSGSMLPTIQIGDHLFVNKLAYNLNVPFLGYEVIRWGHVQRGDIVVFLSPRKDANRSAGGGHAAHANDGAERIDLIKRVVAVGGDTVEIRDKVLYVNGQKVDDVHAHFFDTRHHSVPKRDTFGPVVVPEGKLFCLGDNRDHSHDSRFWGFADEADVKGKATFIYWSRAAGEMPRWARFGRVIR
jgi:signal peptidase I